ncbi:RTA1 like protein-domain-containing protein [Mycena albidolilacea]|uniref:RTA1 like protein-domain-containing protein n=1 Tax=Mycena albidolilacea TaxID=1033008 RepID=A0AAD6Z3Q1_9AGAR|nr:RTA1 like protein-domain-containing protein [Mycena albidolilacea]
MSTLKHPGSGFIPSYRIGWIFPTACICALGALIGGSGRHWFALDLRTVAPFMMQILLPIASPTPLVAVNFFLLSRITIVLGPCYARLSPRWYMIVFPSIDVVALLVKVTGGWTVAVATDYASAQRGAHIVLGGILVQFAVAITYWCLASDFFIHYAFDRPVKVRMSYRAVIGLQTARMIYTLGFSSLILFMRPIFRLIEFADFASGCHNSLIADEVYFFILEGPMVVLATVAINLENPPVQAPTTGKAGGGVGGGARLK